MHVVSPRAFSCVRLVNPTRTFSSLRPTISSCSSSGTVGSVLRPSIASLTCFGHPSSASPAFRLFSTTPARDMKILAVLYSGGKSAHEEPRLLGTVENALGIRSWLESLGHEYIVTDDKEGPNSTARKHIQDADICITTPFWPFYLTKEVLDSAKNLKLAVTAGIGSDHVDLDEAVKRQITVAEVTGSNVVSVAEHVVMSILINIRNYDAAHQQAINGDWDIAAIARDTYDLEGKTVGTIGAGRIGFRVLQRLKPFDVNLLYYDYQSLPAAAEKEVGATRVAELKDFLGKCDIVTVNAPLHDGTKGLINKETIGHMKQGALLVNTARGAICIKEDVAEAVNSGRLMAYAGDTWFPQPAPKDHPWRSMKNPRGGGNGMVPHISGSSIDAQKRYSDGTKTIIQNFFEGKAQNPTDLIVDGGAYSSKAYGQR